MQSWGNFTESELRETILCDAAEHIYNAYLQGTWSFEIAETCLKTLEQAIGGNVWLEMPVASAAPSVE